MTKTMYFWYSTISEQFGTTNKFERDCHDRCRIEGYGGLLLRMRNYCYDTDRIRKIIEPKILNEEEWASDPDKDYDVK